MPRKAAVLSEEPIIMLCVENCTFNGTRFYGPRYSTTGEELYEGDELQVTREDFIREMAKGRMISRVIAPVPGSSTATHEKTVESNRPVSPLFAHFVLESGPDDIIRLYQDAFYRESANGRLNFAGTFKVNPQELAIFAKPKGVGVKSDKDNPSIADVPQDDLVAMSSADLRSMARKKGILLPPGKTKFDYIQAIKEHQAENLTGEPIAASA